MNNTGEAFTITNSQTYLTPRLHQPPLHQLKPAGDLLIFRLPYGMLSATSTEQPAPAGVITCRAAVAWGPGEPLAIEEVEVSPPQPMEIRIKVVCTSLCRSDLTAWQSQALTSVFPRIFGHEASGIIESVGQGVTEFKEGDHVLTLFTGECMSCKHCTSGKSNMCQVLGLERKGVMHSDKKTRFSIKGKPAYHYCAVSSFSEYTVVHSGCAVKISSIAPLERICLLSCGVAAGLGAAWKVADISEGSTVVIFGLGTVGLSVAQGARLRKASRIIGVDTNPGKRDKATAFGVTDFINPNEFEEPIQEVIKRITNGGTDFSFECVGDTEMITTALQSCCDGWGQTVTLGVPKAKPEITAHYALFFSGKTLTGSLFGGWKPKSDIPSLVDMYMKKIFSIDSSSSSSTDPKSSFLQNLRFVWELKVVGPRFFFDEQEIQIDEYVTHDLPFEDINKAFDLMKEGKCLRCVIHMHK